MNRRYRVIEIPLKASTEEEVIELSIDNLPDVAELVDLLRNELSPLSLWLHAALTYYREGKEEEFRDILETVRADTEKSHLQLTPWILEMSTMPDYKQDLLRILDTLAAYYVAQANKERNRERKKELQNKVAVLYTAGDKLTTESHAEGPSSSSSSSSKNKDAQDNRHELNHLVGRAFFLLVDLNQNNFANALDQADQQFTFVFNNNNANIPTLVGKACISFNKKDYKGALTYYRRCLRNNPQCPANIRLGMGHCFYKLNQLEKARLAFERALKLDHKCVGAMVALAIMELNKKNPEAIQNGVQMLSRAYNIDKTHPMVLNHLADHFFFKRDYQRVHQLALHAFQNTENEFMRAESSYQLGRAYHIQENYNQAFQYYYQSTQFAAPSFVLPFYGLGQMYIFRGDLENAAVCFDRVLKFYPNNYETMKILGSIYAQSADPAKRGMARDYLKKVTEAHPDDVEAWIELAQILEQFDLQGALNSYNNAIKIFKEIAENTGREEPEIPAEIYNNVAVLHYRLGAFEAAEENLERSLRVANDEAEHDEAYFRLIQVSIRYNFGRLYEATYRLVKANEVYVALLRDHPTHTDSMIRLGCLRREACHIYEASDWFKEVLQVDKDNADAWILIANMHCAKSEWGPGQKKYERVLGAEATKDDTYALVALGNIWLHTLFSGGKGGGTREEREKERRHQERAISMYRNALRQDELNLYAANGIGCVLAAKGAFNEARDVFSQVREATADFPDVWVNIAHIYVETRQYVNAIQMYENCHRRFYPAPNTEILMYIARAYYRWGRMRQCKTVLLRIRHVTPNDATVIFNLALVLQRIAASVLEEPKCPLRTILSAVHELNLAHRYFDHLRLNPEPTKFDPVAAGAEEQRCKDLITQAQHHVARARRADAEEQEARRRQEAERAALRAKAQEETRAREEERRKVEKELIAKRQEFVAKTKSILIFDPQMEEKPKKGGGGRGRKSAHHGEDGFVTDSSSNIENRTAGGGGGGEKTGGKKKKKKKEGKRGRKRRNRGSGGSAESDEEGGGGEVNEEERRKRREERQQQKRKKQRKGGQKESAKKGRPSKPEKAEQPGKFKSKAYISSSDSSSSSSSAEGAGKKAAENAVGGAAGSDQEIDDRENVPKVPEDVMPDLSSSDSDGAGDRRRKNRRRSRSRSASSRSSRSRSVGSRSRSSSQSGAESPQVQKKKKQQKQKQSPKKTAKAKGRRGRILSESSQSSGSDLDRPPASSPVRRSPSSASSSSRSEGEEGGGAGDVVRASSSRSSSLHSSPANRGGGGGGGGSSSSEDDSRPYYRPAQPTDRDSDSEVERSPKSNHSGSGGEEEDSDGSRRSGGGRGGPAAVGGGGRGSDVSRSGSDDSD